MPYKVVGTWLLEMKPGTVKQSVGAWLAEIEFIKTLNVGECYLVIPMGTSTEKAAIKAQLLTDIKKSGNNMVRMVLNTGKMYLLRQ
jgi:hypothetical protein